MKIALSRLFYAAVAAILLFTLFQTIYQAPKPKTTVTLSIHSLANIRERLKVPEKVEKVIVEEVATVADTQRVSRGAAAETAEVNQTTFTVTFYTSMVGNGDGITASGEKLAPGFLANNQLPFGTIIYLEGYGNCKVMDRGSSKHFPVVTRIDMYIPRKPGESNTQYQQRVAGLGVKKIKGYIKR